MIRDSGRWAVVVMILTGSLLVIILLRSPAAAPATGTSTVTAVTPTPGVVVGEARAWSPGDDGWRCYLYTSPYPYGVPCAEWRRTKLGDTWP